MHIEEKRSFLSIVAYGIHSKYEKDLRRLIEKESNCKSIFVYEYFLDKPYVRGQKGKKCSGYLPFLLRILNEQKFVPKIVGNFPEMWNEIGFSEFNFDNLWEFWSSSYKGAAAEDISHTNIGGKLFTSWKNKSAKEENNWRAKYDERTGIVEGVFKFKSDFLKNDYLKEIAKKPEISRIGQLKEFMISIYPWLLCRDIKEIYIAALSISTSSIFYGYILVFYPPLEGGNILKSKDGSETLAARKLKELIANTYVTTLSLFENFCEEKELSDTLSNPNWEEYIFLEENLNNSEDRFERSLYLLWKARRVFYESFSPKNEAQKIIKQSLLFSKYLIASPSMVDKMKMIVYPREQNKEFSEKDYLPCFLVIGMPGTGKDTLAQIIQLFFPEYRFGKRYIINMAALKPNFLSVPLLSGFEGSLTSEIQLGDQKEKLNLDSKIKGIFLKIWEDHNEYFGRKDAKEKGLMPVVILDELNSLDIDAQGSLLRILQNAKLQPLGSPTEAKEKIDFLVIGTVNEPDEILTLEKPLREFLTEKGIFGGVLGRTLYEHLRNIRRLRDDLYYRLIRNGKIEIPALNKRREDIPILFSFFVKKDLNKEIGSNIRWDHLWFDFAVFEELMNETLTWSGNFRELETIAKKVTSEVLLDRRNRDVIKSLRRNEDPQKPVQILFEHMEEIIKVLWG